MRKMYQPVADPGFDLTGGHGLCQRGRGGIIERVISNLFWPYFYYKISRERRQRKTLTTSILNEIKTEIRKTLKLKQKV